MSTLLESRISHRRHRLLSRKARETELDNEDPPRRRVPCPDRDGATNVCFPKILSNSSAVDDALRKSSPAYRRGQGQRRRQEQKRKDRFLTQSVTNKRLRLVRTIAPTRLSYTHYIYRSFLLMKKGTLLLESE